MSELRKRLNFLSYRWAIENVRSSSDEANTSEAANAAVNIVTKPITLIMLSSNPIVIMIFRQQQHPKRNENNRKDRRVNRVRKVAKAETAAMKLPKNMTENTRRLRGRALPKIEGIFKGLLLGVMCSFLVPTTLC